MTRDEAIEIEFKTARAWPEFNNLADMIVRKAASVAIDGYVALGMLKLDEPKRDDECWHLAPRIVETLKGAYVGATLRQPLLEGDVHFIIGWLESAGLKIVEK